MRICKSFLVIALVINLSACAVFKRVRQQDIDAWVGAPVEALDTHSLFLTVPMFRTMTESGIEIRNYANGINRSSCYGSAGANRLSSNWVTASAFASCTSGWVGCNNIFYIKDGKVIDYAPTGRCYTDKTVQPEPRFKRLLEAGSQG